MSAYTTCMVGGDLQAYFCNELVSRKIMSKTTVYVNNNFIMSFSLFLLLSTVAGLALGVFMVLSLVAVTFL